MKLSQWNRFRNDTFKDRREDELAFIPGQAPAAEGGVAMNLKAPQAPSIKTVFTLTDQGVHTQKDGTQVPCCWWTCVQKGCKLRGSPIKEIRKGTGLLFRHLRKCNHVLWLELQLSSKHSKAQLDEEGQLVHIESMLLALPLNLVERAFSRLNTPVDLPKRTCYVSKAQHTWTGARDEGLTALAGAQWAWTCRKPTRVPMRVGFGICKDCGDAGRLKYGARRSRVMRSGSNMGPGGRGEEVLSGRGLGENQRGPDEWVLGFRQSDVRGSQCGACDVLRSSIGAWRA